MKKILSALIILSTSLCAQESTGDAAGYASRDATVLSMMGWGVAIAAGAAAIVCLIPNHTTTNH